MNKLSLIKNINNLKHMKSINNFYLVKTIIEHVIHTYVLRRPIVFLRIRCNICVRYSILILSIKIVRCIIVRCTLCKYSEDPNCRAFSRGVCGRSHAGFVGSNPAGGIDCLSLVSVVCCQVEVSASGRSLSQRSPTECDTSDCDRETSTMRWVRPEYSLFAT